MINLLTDNADNIEFFSHLSKIEQDAILQIRSLVTELMRSEKTALAILMTHSYATSLQACWVDIKASMSWGKKLTDAFFLIKNLSPASKRLIAIELLHQVPVLDAEEEEEDEEVYGEEDDFDPYSEVETFRDRRLDR